MESGLVFDQVIGATISHYRKQAGFNQHQASEIASISVSSLSRLEKGDYTLSVEQLIRLANAYEVGSEMMLSSIQRTHQHADQQGITVKSEKKSKTGMLLLGAAAVAALVIASK